MAYEIALTRRTNGGYTVVADGETWYPSELKYHGTDGGVILYGGRLNLLRYYLPDEWTIQTVTGFTTVVDVCDALDALGVLASDTFEDMEALLTTIDADTSAIKVAVQLMDDDLDDARIALQVIDDWDESDRAKVNPIVGQAGIAAGAGAVGATVPRVTLASDDPAVAALQTIDNAVDGNYLNVNQNIAGTDVAAGTGTQNAQTLRVVLATDQAQLTNALKVTGATSAPAVLVAAGSAANVTGSWADFGAEITTGSAHTLALWLAVTHTDSVNVRVRILGKHTAATGAEFLIPIKTISSTDVKVNGHYYELDSDATQNVVLDWDVSAVPYVQVQIQCETVGATADTVSGDYTLMF